MQIGEQYLLARQFFALRGEWLLYLHDQFSAAEYSVAVGYDLGPSTFMSLSPNPAPAPACLSTTTWCPFSTSSRTVEGTMPTRYSLSLISRGTPTNMATPAASCAAPAKDHAID